MARSMTKQKSAVKPARRRPRKTSRRRPAVAAANEAVLAVFAHDIRTALTGILALGELLAEGGFERSLVRRAARDPQPPHFMTLVATGLAPASTR